MLYDGMIKAVHEAKLAIEQGRIEDRFNSTQKASKILLGLQANLDFENGGRMAVMLDQFYHTIFRDLQQINMKNSPALCTSVIAALKEVRESWDRLANKGDIGNPEVRPSRAPSSEKSQQSAENEPAGEGTPGGLTLSI